MNVKQNYYFYNIHYVAILAGIKPHQSKELVTTQYNSVPRAGVNSLRDPVDSTNLRLYKFGTSWEIT